MIVAGMYGKETVIARGEPMEGVDGFFKFTFNVDLIQSLQFVQMEL